MIRRRTLEIVLSKLKDIDKPRPELEQYRTPDGIVAEIVFLAFGNGSIEGKRVFEPGCGGAPFLIAAGLLGARLLTGIDIDPESVASAKRNIADVDRTLGTDISSIAEIIEGDIEEYNGEGQHDTILMNPPFGAQRKGADRPFLDAAMRTRGEIYSLHNARGISFVKDRMMKADYMMVEERAYRFPLPHRFTFHTEERSEVDVRMLHSRPVAFGRDSHRPAMTNVK